MYLFSIEGGDGSGKGLATEIVSEILQSEFCFTSVDTTAEPRRDHPLGRLAIDSVRKQTLTPEEEAGLFAAARRPEELAHPASQLLNFRPVRGPEMPARYVSLDA